MTIGAGSVPAAGTPTQLHLNLTPVETPAFRPERREYSGLKAGVSRSDLGGDSNPFQILFRPIGLKACRTSIVMPRKAIFLSIGLILLAMVAGCSSVDRSRSLGNPGVSANTLALQVCSNCHGVQGISVSPNFPNLAAQSPLYLEAQLKSFKNHGRSDPAGFEYMWGISARLSDEQIAGLAAYFSSRQPGAGKPRDPKMVNDGQSIFEQGIAAAGTPACTGCHGAKGEGMQQFPRLAGQHADYLVKQLTVFARTDQRPEGGVMKTIAHGLTRENMENVAAYLEAMPLAR